MFFELISYFVFIFEIFWALCSLKNSSINHIRWLNCSYLLLFVHPNVHLYYFDAGFWSHCKTSLKFFLISLLFTFRYYSSQLFFPMFWRHCRPAKPQRLFYLCTCVVDSLLVDSKVSRLQGYKVTGLWLNYPFSARFMVG